MKGVKSTEMTRFVPLTAVGCCRVCSKKMCGRYVWPESVQVGFSDAVLRGQQRHLSTQPPPLRPCLYPSFQNILTVGPCFGGTQSELDSSSRADLQPLAFRFGFHNGSSIDSLLDKDNVSLEAILDEDDLLQECKAQNTRLIDYFQRLDVLQRLLGYVTGQIEGEDRGRFKCVAS